MELTHELQEKKRLMIDGLKKTYKVQYDAVQPIPYIKDRLYCVDKVFVEGGVEVCLAPELTLDTDGSWERLEYYKHIYTDSRLNSKRRIIQGEPGYGKSTLTLQLAYDWCNDVWNSSMRNVDILILLRLRQLGGIQSIYRAIKIYLLADEPRLTVDDIKKIIQSCSSVNIILDGYDEYPDRDSNNNNDVDKMIVMELFQNDDVTLTTRYLPKRLIKETKMAKLTGFDEKARDEYIRKAVVGDNEEAVEHIKRTLYENLVLADICQVPLIFVMFAHMAHDLKHFMKFTSVTQFFKYMIGCFHEHLKRKFRDTKNKIFYIHETEHHELDKIAFEGLNKQNQQLTWKKKTFQESVSQALYEQYISIGILVEEQVVSGFSEEGYVLYTTEVRFYHKLFCEWYAAHYFVSVVMTESYLANALRFLDPFDLQYLYRFACGLHPDAGKKLIDYLKSRPGGDTFAILCILEQTGDVNDIMDAVKDLCSRDVKIQKGDSALLQRSTTQLLEIASNNNIPITGLHLNCSSVKIEGKTVVLHSGIPLPKLPTVEMIHIAASDTKDDNLKTLTEKDIVNWFHYGMQSTRIKELMFEKVQLPTCFPTEALSEMVKDRNIQVRWRPFDMDFHWDPKIADWEVDSIDSLRELCSDTIYINDSDDLLKQRSTIQLIHIASNHDIHISSLCLEKSFGRIDAGCIILTSGLKLLCPVSVKKVIIHTKEEGEMTETEFVDLLNYVQHSHMLEELRLDDWLMPVTFSNSSLEKIIISRNIYVSWCPFDDIFYLDLQTGHWEVDNIDFLQQLCSDTINIEKSDGILKQRSTIQLTQIASNHNIPISSLCMERSFGKIDSGCIILTSGLKLSCPVSLKKLIIHTDYNREMTETEFVDLLNFVQHSHMLKELRLHPCMMPVSFSHSSFPKTLKSRNIDVSWCPCNDVFRLNLKTGQWEVDSIDALRQLCSDTIYINDSDDLLKQRSTIQLIHIASNHDIPITCLYLQNSFSKTDAGKVILQSGLRLSCPVSIIQVVIGTKEEKEMSETDVSEDESETTDTDDTKEDNEATEPEDTDEDEETTQIKVIEIESETNETKVTEEKSETTETENTEGERETTDTGDAERQRETIQIKATDKESKTEETKVTVEERETTESTVTEGKREISGTEVTENESETTETKVKENEKVTTETYVTEREREITEIKVIEVEREMFDTKVPEGESEMKDIKGTEVERETTETEFTEEERGISGTEGTEVTEEERETTDAWDTERQSAIIQIKATDEERKTKETNITMEESETTETTVTEGEREIPGTEVTENESETTETKVTEVEKVTTDTKVTDIKREMSEKKVTDEESEMKEIEDKEEERQTPETKVTDIKREMSEKKVTDEESEMKQIEDKEEEREKTEIDFTEEEREISGTEVKEVKEEESETTETEDTEEERETADTGDTERQREITQKTATDKESKTKETNVTVEESETKETTVTEGKGEISGTEVTENESETAETKIKEEEKVTTETEVAEKEREITETNVTKVEREKTETKKESEMKEREDTEEGREATETEFTEEEREISGTEVTEVRQEENEMTETNAKEEEKVRTETEVTEGEREITKTNVIEEENETRETQVTEEERGSSETEGSEEESETTDTDDAKEYSKMTETEFVDILTFVQTSHLLKELRFDGGLMPVCFSPSSLMQNISSRNFNVSWCPFDDVFYLNLKTGQWQVDSIDSLSQLCSDTIYINNSDDIFKQRSTIQLIQIASNHNIPISCLYLKKCFKKIDSGKLILHSGLFVSCPVTVKKVMINTEINILVNKYMRRLKKITKKMVVDILMFVQQSHLLKELRFDGCILPVSFSTSSVTKTIISRNIHVSWCPFNDVFRLNLQTGQWEVDNIDSLRQLCSETITIDPNDKILESFSKLDEDDVIAKMFQGFVNRLSSDGSLTQMSTIELSNIASTYNLCSDTISIDTFDKFLEYIEALDEDDATAKMFQLLADMLFMDGSLTQMSTIELRNTASTHNVDAMYSELGEKCLSDGILKQRSTIQLLHIASNHSIPISCLCVERSLDYFGRLLYIPISSLCVERSLDYIDDGRLFLQAGLCLQCPSSVKRVVIKEQQPLQMTETQVVDILMFVKQSHTLEELEFSDVLLPLTFSFEPIFAEMQSRNIKVFWKDYAYILNLQSCAWEVGEVDVVRKLCAKEVCIGQGDSLLQQKCTIQLLENASNYDIPISCLHLRNSFRDIDANIIILWLGLRLSCPLSVKKVMMKMDEEQVSKTEFVKILIFVQQSHLLEELEFTECVCPQTIPAESIPSILKSRNVKVSWWVDYNREFILNLQSGRWMDNISGLEMTYAEYDDTKQMLRMLPTSGGGNSSWCTLL